MVTSQGLCFAATVVACSWLRIPKSIDRNSEVALRLQMWETGQVSEQQHLGPLRKRKREMQPQTDEQRGKRACALTARESISTALKALVGGAAQGCLPKELNHSPDPARSSGSRTHPNSAECAEAAKIAWRSGRYKTARSAMREQGRSSTGIASLRTSNCRL